MEERRRKEIETETEKVREREQVRLAYFAIGDVYLNTSIRTGLDWSPFEFVMSSSESKMAPL